MAQITFTINGPRRAVTLRAMLLAFQNQLSILNDLDATLSGSGEPMLEWIVSDINSSASVTGTIESQPRRDSVPFGHDALVERTYHNGWSVIEGGAQTPEYYSDSALRKAKSTFQLIGHEGVTGYEIRDALQPDELISLTPRGAVNVELLIKPGHKAIGSVEGRLSVISLKTRKPKFEIVTSVTKKAVSCTFEDTLLDEVKSALGKRVLVGGLITYNTKGDPLKIAMDSPLRLLRSIDQLPTTREMTGAFRRLTGDLTTAQYLELVRG